MLLALHWHQAAAIPAGHGAIICDRNTASSCMHACWLSKQVMQAGLKTGREKATPRPVKAVFLAHLCLVCSPHTHLPMHPHIHALVRNKPQPAQAKKVCVRQWCHSLADGECSLASGALLLLELSCIHRLVFIQLLAHIKAEVQAYLHSALVLDGPTHSMHMSEEFASAFCLAGMHTPQNQCARQSRLQKDTWRRYCAGYCVRSACAS